jgi:gamma-glutamyltranspeptidase/glutathione hydrolase/leukotriene-C4 hydrolase
MILFILRFSSVVLEEGGNAVDAAIATAFCIGAVNPQSSGIGGGFFMTVYDPVNQTAQCLDAREVAPIAATKNMFRKKPLSYTKGPVQIACGRNAMFKHSSSYSCML